MRRSQFLFALLLVARQAAAHDFWLEPSTFQPAIGQTVTASLRVGMQFAGEPVTRMSDAIISFGVRDADGDRPVGGDDYTDPAGEFKVRTGGTLLVSYVSRPQLIWMPAGKFEEHLRLEGLDAVAAARLRRGDTGKPARERFSRFAKSLLHVGAAGRSSPANRPVGLTLELVPDHDPYDLAGGPIGLRLLYQSKPIAGVLVSAFQQDDPVSLRLSARSDADGHVVFRLPAPGVWLIKAVHAIPAPPGANADWDSLWASLTFRWENGKTR